MGLFDRFTGKSGGSSAPSVGDKSFLIDKIKQSELFNKLSAENLDEMYKRMETVARSKGEPVIREGEEGDYYYLLVLGTAQVSRKDPSTGKVIVIANLDEPKGFGEEALISNSKRNATVTMTTDGKLMRLSKDTFNDYIKEPLLTWFSPSDAQEKVAQGAKWLDVRSANLAKQSHLQGALAIPVEDIRARMSELDKSLSYVCYCDNGRTSSTAAFLMSQKGFSVGVLRGGLQSLKSSVG